MVICIFCGSFLMYFRGSNIDRTPYRWDLRLSRCHTASYQSNWNFSVEHVWVSLASMLLGDLDIHLNYFVSRNDCFLSARGVGFIKVVMWYIGVVQGRFLRKSLRRSVSSYNDDETRALTLCACSPVHCNCIRLMCANRGVAWTLINWINRVGNFQK